MSLSYLRDAEKERGLWRREKGRTLFIYVSLGGLGGRNRTGGERERKLLTQGWGWGGAAPRGRGPGVKLRKASWVLGLLSLCKRSCLCPGNSSQRGHSGALGSVRGACPW